MNKFLFSTMSVSVADGVEEPFELEYYIIENQTQNESINISTYGIEIVKTQRREGIKYTEIKTMNEICVSEKMIYNIARLLSDNSVTPLTLEEIIDDIVDKKGRFNNCNEVSSTA
ncbi:MAG: hypothetical protein BWY15_01403 [Firmicutes bacterium ADurb.Bin193]|nr:MAG: hypothetical protein BWY15_01403 [Firmicutes bacterium ADurb.Bin193]